MKILLTGFNSFANVVTNPSQQIVEKIDTQKFLSEIEIITEVLPTEFVAAGKKIEELITTISPQIILLLGVAAKRKHISLERVALNLNDSSLPDNTGLRIEGKQIVENEPLAYFSSLPLLHLKEQLEKNDIPCEVSNHAGTYVCNHTFYLALRKIKQLRKNTACSFIHVPTISQIEEPNAISLEKLILGIEILINSIHKYYAV
ncbi:peptidase C15 [Candidatus Uabimicrobium sp. HlEnr_7]|uniref:pyroglutamyl-peptidase I family protein n=1 Tax=Candidatus Uabimicrobium helgolandensis TaxID=3095367 RepID=UPI0035571FE5